MKYTANCHNDLTKINDTAKSLLLKRVLTDRRDSIKTLSEYIDHLIEYGDDRYPINNSKLNYGACSLQSNNGIGSFNDISYRFKNNKNGSHYHHQGMDGIMAHNDSNVYIGTSHNRFYVINAITINRSMERVVVIESIPLDLLMIDFTAHYYDLHDDNRYEWDDMVRLRTITILNVDENTAFTYFPNKTVNPNNVKSRGFKKSIGAKNANKLNIKYNGLAPNVSIHDMVYVVGNGRMLKEIVNTCNHKVANLLYEYLKDCDSLSLPFEHSFYENFRTDNESVNELLYNELKEESLKRYDRDDVFTDMSLDMLSLINGMSTYSFYAIHDDPEDRPFSIRDFLQPTPVDPDQSLGSIKEYTMDIMKHPLFKDGALYMIDNSGGEPTVKLTSIGRKIFQDLEIDVPLPSMGLLFGYTFLREVIYTVYFDKSYIKDFLKRTCYV